MVEKKGLNPNLDDGRPLPSIIHHKQLKYSWGKPSTCQAGMFYLAPSCNIGCPRFRLGDEHTVIHAEAKQSGERDSMGTAGANMVHT